MKGESPMTREKTCYAGIDMARFAFAIIIVLFHCSHIFDEGFLLQHLDFVLFSYLERFVVPFFFICAGFFLYRDAGPDSFSMTKQKQYLLRILRLYLIWTVIYLPLSVSAFRYDEKGIGNAVMIYLRDTVLTGSYYHLWFLPALIMAVALIAILTKYRVSPNTVLLTAAAFYAVGLLAQSWFGLIRPLEQLAPGIWSWLRRIQHVIVTTRNGLFEGFLFVSIGMCFAVYRPVFSRSTEIRGCAFFMVALLGEILLLRHLGWSREENCYLFLVPASFFLFALLRDLNLKNRPAFQKLRKPSGLIYYLHPLLIAAAGFLTERTKLQGEWLAILNYGSVVVLSIVIAQMIVRFSGRKGFRWLRALY